VPILVATILGGIASAITAALLSRQDIRGVISSAPSDPAPPGPDAERPPVLTTTNQATPAIEDPIAVAGAGVDMDDLSSDAGTDDTPGLQTPSDTVTGKGNPLPYSE